MRFILLAALLTVAPVRADDETNVVSVGLEIPKKKTDRVEGPLDAVELHAWIPADAKAIRGFLVNPFNSKAVEQKHWREACSLWGFGIIGANYFGVDKREFGRSLAEGMRKLAEAKKRPELTNACFCFVGMSAGAGMCMAFAEQMPERTIAVAPVCLEVGPFTKTTAGIPVITIFGEKDGQQMKLLTDRLPRHRIEDGVRWAIAVQWGRKHEFAYANNLAAPFFDSCIRLRYPGDGDSKKGPVKLKDIELLDGWSADIANWGRNPARVQSIKFGLTTDAWFPDEAISRIWQGFVMEQPTLVIESPFGLGDGKPFIPHKAGEPIVVKVKGAKACKEVILRVGAKDVGKLDNAAGLDVVEITWEKPPSGVHALTVRGGDTVSRPATVIVAK